MLAASSALSFHHFGSNWLESWEFDTAGGGSMIVGVILVGTVLLGYALVEPSRMKRRAARMVKKFPGPRAYPVVGNARQLKIPVEAVFSWLESVPKNWGQDVVRFWVAGCPKLLINSDSVAKKILSEIVGVVAEKTLDFEELKKRPEGHSLARLSADMHTYGKKSKNPKFSLVVEQDAFEIYCRHATKIRHRLTESVLNGKAFDVLEYTRMANFQIACERAMGHELFQDLWDMDYCSQLEAWKSIHGHLLSRPYNPFKKYDLLHHSTSTPKAVQEYLTKINQFGDLAIFLRRQRWDYLKSHRFLNDDPPSETGSPQCLLDLLLQLEDTKDLTREQVLHDLNLSLASAYDTTGPCLAWILKLLAMHPEIQTRCVHELLNVLHSPETEPRPGSSLSCNTIPPHYRHHSSYYTISSRNFYGDPIPLTTSDFNRLPFLHAVITEALRLYPAFPYHLGPTDKDITLDNGQIIPAGVDISLNSYSMHRNPTLFPNPLHFNPDRFTPSSPSLSSSNLLPFPAGLRPCPAGILEEDMLQQLKILLIHLLLAFRWESPSTDLDTTNNNKSNGRISNIITTSSADNLFPESLVASDDRGRVLVKIAQRSCQ